MDLGARLERALLERELARLHAQIAVLQPDLRPPRAVPARAGGSGGGPPQQVIWDLLSRNDAEVEKWWAAGWGDGGRASPPPGADAEGGEGGRAGPPGGRKGPESSQAELERAGAALVELNAGFTGINLSWGRCHSRLLAAPLPSSSLRRHVLHGSAGGGCAVALACEFDVLETEGRPAEEAGKGQKAPAAAAAYEVVRMEAKVTGEGVVASEVDEWVQHCCRLCSPPLLFRSIRLYALLARERALVFCALTERRPTFTAVARGEGTEAADWRAWLGAAALKLCNAAGASLTLAYALEFEPLGSVSPSIDLFPRVPSGALGDGTTAAALVGEVPERFRDLVAAGRRVEDVVDAMCEIMLVREGA